jgi:Cdc6-like AAA superfamily ATPase
MTIENVTDDQFRDIIRRHFTPGRAISSTEYLRGREAKLRQIDRAFNSEGKHIFIHGDRGVGKTSVARTAAFIHASSKQTPPTIECEKNVTSYQLLRDIAVRCVAAADFAGQVTVKKSFKGGFPLLSGEVTEEIKRGQIPEFKSVNDALSVIGYLASISTDKPNYCYR